MSLIRKVVADRRVYRFEGRGISMPLPFFLAAVPAGFPSPAEDYIDAGLDLNDYLVKHPAATFFFKVQGDSMSGIGIFSGDIAIADRAVKPVNNSVVIAAVDGELTLKRLRKANDKCYLVPENPAYAVIEMTPETQLQIWGVVTYVIHETR